MSTNCDYNGCPCAAIAACEHCGNAFCSDHGSCGGDHQIENVGAVAYPAQCWKCGGFNADAE